MRRGMLMTPGPTEIHWSVRRALGKRITNPDLDLSFFEFYRETAERFKALFRTVNDVLILDGEGILGLEAACASLIEPGDRVLCLDNGLYGRGFGDFVRLYGGVPVFFEGDVRKGLDPGDLASFLAKDHDFRLCTLVHCETPSGITNPVDRIGPLLRRYGILSVVDSVSAIGGEELRTDEWGLDVVLAGSQKCLSAPPGLTIASISPAAWERMEARRTPIGSFYGSFLAYRGWYEKRLFPYTQPVNELNGLRAALDRLLKDRDAVGRHRRIAGAVRECLEAAGLELYPVDSRANTVSAVLVPEGVSFEGLFSRLRDRTGVLIAGNYGDLAGKVFRIGHMGENARPSRVRRCLKGLDATFRELGVPLRSSLHKGFSKSLRKQR